MAKKGRSKAFDTTVLPLFFCCQLATLGLLRQTPSYSLWETEINAFPVFSLWIARILSVAVLLVALTMALRGCRFLRLRTMLAVNGASLLIGFVLTFYYAYSLPVYFAAQCLIGIAHAWILLCWAEYLTSLEKPHRNRSIAFAALIAVLIFTIMGAAPQSMQAVCFLAIACGSVLPLFLTPQNGGEYNKEASGGKALDTRRSLASIPWELVVLMASYAMLFRILVFFNFPAVDGSMQTVAAAVIRIGGMILLLLYLSRVQFAPNTQQMIIPLFFLTLLGLLLLPGREGIVATVAVALVESSWTFFYVLIWLILPEIANSKKADPFIVLVGGWTALNLLLLLAAPLAYFFEVQVNQGTLSLTALVLIIVYTLAVALLLYRNSAKRLLAKQSPSWEKEQEDHFAALAEEHGLTPRENDVFQLLVQGYSLPAIEKKFVLSHSTVKTHARHVYEKFGVSGKQELIERVKRSQHIG